MTEGKKADTGKAPLARGGFLYFPRALAAVARCSEFGLKKYNLDYEDRNFLEVEGGFGRYTDGMLRHLAGEVTDEGGVDPETSLPHAYAVAWNALARLELKLKEEEQPLCPTAPRFCPDGAGNLWDCSDQGCPVHYARTRTRRVDPRPLTSATEADSGAT